MTVTGQKKLSIYDPATGTVVQLNNISEEGEFEKKGAFIKTSAGGRMYSGDESKAEFLSLDWTGYDQLVAWMKDRTPVRFVTYGLDEHILWYEDTLITVDLKTVFAPFKRSGFKIYFEKAGGVHSVYKGANLLYIIDGWGDVDSNGLIDGSTLEGTANPTASIVNTNQRITAAVAGNIRVVRYDFIYPVVGAQLSFANKVMGGNISNAIIELTSLSFSNTPVADSFVNIDSVITMITVGGTYKLKVYYLAADNLNQGDYIDFKKPILSTMLTLYKEINY